MRCFVTMKTTLAIALVLLTTATPDARQGAATTTNKPGSLALTVAGENGMPLSGANVRLTGASNDRVGTSGADGLVTLVNLSPGTYRARINRDGYNTLEKEVTIRAAARLAAEAVLTAAPPPPAPPPPPPAPVAPATSTTLKPGSPSYSSIIDLATQMEKALRDTPTVERDLGCSGGSVSRLIMTRENVAMHTHADADEMVYVVAGEATLTVADKDQGVQAGWFSVVPRGMSHSLTRRGRNPLLILSVRSGPACPGL